MLMVLRMASRSATRQAAFSPRGEHLVPKRSPAIFPMNINQGSSGEEYLDEDDRRGERTPAERRTGGGDLGAAPGGASAQVRVLLRGHEFQAQPVSPNLFVTLYFARVGVLPGWGAYFALFFFAGVRASEACKYRARYDGVKVSVLLGRCEQL